MDTSHFDDWMKAGYQDNSAPQRTAVGESTLTYNHPKDNYAQGMDAWKSVSRFMKRPPASEPDPSIGKHAEDEITLPEMEKDAFLGKALRAGAKALPAAGRFFGGAGKSLGGVGKALGGRMMQGAQGAGQAARQAVGKIAPSMGSSRAPMSAASPMQNLFYQATGFGGHVPGAVSQTPGGAFHFGQRAVQGLPTALRSYGLPQGVKRMLTGLGLGAGLDYASGNQFSQAAYGAMQPYFNQFANKQGMDENITLSGILGMKAGATDEAQAARQPVATT